MGISINTNTDASNASRLLGITQAGLSSALSKLASGRRINSAVDDASGLAISEVLNSQVRGANAASRNAQDGISLIQTADGALSSTSDSLQRIRELTVQAGNGTLNTSQRSSIQNEISSLQQGIDATANQAQFNNRSLLNGTNPTTQLQVGANAGASNTATITLPNATATALGVGPGQVDVSTPQAANQSLTAIDQAIDNVSSARSTLGAQQNDLEHTTANLNVSAENQLSAQSRIQDLDFAKGVSDQTRGQILSDVGAAVLAQANFSRQSVVQLLR